MLLHDGYVALATSEAKTAADLMLFNSTIDEKIRQFFLDNTDITAEEYDLHARHQWFLFADEMLEKNLIDRIIGQTEEWFVWLKGGWILVLFYIRLDLYTQSQLAL